MKKNNKLLAFICAAATAASGLTLSMPYNVFADATKVVSIGNDLTDAQKKTMLKYFGIEGDQSVQRINVTNKDEISHLSSYIPLDKAKGNNNDASDDEVDSFTYGARFLAHYYWSCSADIYSGRCVLGFNHGVITTGVGGGHFDPTATCTRAQIAAFLARSMK